MSCGQVEEYDAVVVAKDKEIAALKAQLAKQKRASVSGAMPYKELCTAAKNEKQRQGELRKGQDFQVSSYQGKV